MRMTYASRERETIEFAEKAARHFKAHPKCWTYSSGELAEGDCLLALRWGCGDDCVVVVKLDEYFGAINFQELVRSVGDFPAAEPPPPPEPPADRIGPHVR